MNYRTTSKPKKYNFLIRKKTQVTKDHDFFIKLPKKHTRYLSFKTKQEKKKQKLNQIQQYSHEKKRQCIYKLNKYKNKHMALLSAIKTNIKIIKLDIPTCTERNDRWIEWVEVL